MRIHQQNSPFHPLLLLAASCIFSYGTPQTLRLGFDSDEEASFLQSPKTSSVGGPVGPLLSTGARGNALYFTGDEKAGLSLKPHPALDATETLSLQFWIWPLPGKDHQGLIWKGDRHGTSPKIQYKLSLRPDGRVEFGCLGPKGDWSLLASKTPIPYRTWTRLGLRFDKGLCELHFGQECVASSSLGIPDAEGRKAPLAALPANDFPVELGRMQRPGGKSYQAFTGAIDELVISRQLPEPESPPAPPPASDPLQSLLLFEHTIDISDLKAKPLLAGKLAGSGPWFLEVSDARRPDALVRTRGTCDARGDFRFLLDDFCGGLDVQAAGKLVCRAYRERITDTLRATEGGLSPGARTIAVRVDPAEKKQVLGPLSIFANPPGSFEEDANRRRVIYRPILDEMRTVGVTHFDLALGSLTTIEPTNDDSDPAHLNMDFYRTHFKKQPEAQTLMKFLRYLHEEGFSFGIRSTSFAKWQTREKPGTGIAEHDVDEIAESWVALLQLMKEENVPPTHLIPIWEPAYAPETVARICAATTLLARKHGFATPVIGPYAYGTGGQSTNILAMPDKFEEGAAYVREYLKATGDMTRVIGLEDYASGTPLIRTNMERMWREAIQPLSKGKPREIWMLEYGAPCGMGPWNFFSSRWHGALSSYEAAFRLARCHNQLLDSGVSRYFFWKAWDSIGDGKAPFPSAWGLIKGIQHDEERRPPFYTARLYWNHMQEGSQVIGCHAEADLAVNATLKDKTLAVFLVNPRSVTVEAAVSVDKTQLAPQARLLSSCEEIQYQEREIYGQDASSFQVKLGPRSINTLLLRTGSSSAPFAQTRWPTPQPETQHLSDLAWLRASTHKGGLKDFSTNGLDVNWRRDETWTGEWLVQQAIRYRKGLSVLGKGEIHFAVPETAGRFAVRLGVDDCSGSKSPATFIIKLDGKPVVSETLSPGHAPKEIDLPLRQVKQLSLHLETEDSRLNADWLEARFLQ